RPLLAGALERLRAPRDPFGVLRDNVQDHVAVDQHGRSHRYSRVSFMISSVLMPVVARPRIRSTRLRPRTRVLRALRIFTALPETSNSTSVSGSSPSRSRISCGIVTCPLLVIRMPPPL